MLFISRKNVVRLFIAGSALLLALSPLMVNLAFACGSAGGGNGGC